MSSGSVDTAELFARVLREAGGGNCEAEEDSEWEPEEADLRAARGDGRGGKLTKKQVRHIGLPTSHNQIKCLLFRHFGISKIIRVLIPGGVLRLNYCTVVLCWIPSLQICFELHIPPLTEIRLSPNRDPPLPLTCLTPSRWRRCMLRSGR